jgi:hypothetical protein
MPPFKFARYTFARSMASRGNNRAPSGVSSRNGASSNAITWRLKDSGIWPNACGFPTFV